MHDAMMRHLFDLRHEPIDQRIRAVLDGTTVVDSDRALLVWEPRRVVASYAVPAADVVAAVEAAGPVTPAAEPPILHPGIPFTVHSSAGESLTVAGRAGAGFRPDDPDLGDHVVLDFDAFDTWYEEDEEVVAHPREPFHRVDTRRSTRHVRIEARGQLLAESRRPLMLLETGLPTRFYLPRADVVAPVLPSDRVTWCAYKGQAGYLSFEAGADLAWTYPDPLPGVRQIAGLVAFFDELVDVTVDGQARQRPDTEFAKAIIEEVGL